MHLVPVVLVATCGVEEEEEEQEFFFEEEGWYGYWVAI